MEFKIQEYRVPESIDFNYDELKTAIQEKVAFYKDLVYTDEQMREAKADRARLRKVIDAIDVQRKQVKADLLQPYTALEQKLDEIKGIIQEPINMIDNQVKAFEELQKQTKTESIKQGWTNKGNVFDINLIWNPKWLNSTYSMKKITEEMDAAIEMYRSSMQTLQSLPEYSFEAVEHYKKTLDLGAAMVHVNDLKEQAKRKAEYEAKVHICREIEPPKPPLPTTAPEEMKWITFTALLTYRQAQELEKFFKMRYIEFRKGE